VLSFTRQHACLMQATMYVCLCACRRVCMCPASPVRHFGGVRARAGRPCRVHAPSNSLLSPQNTRITRYEKVFVMAGNARPTVATGLSAAAGSRTGVVTGPDRHWQACCGNRTDRVEYGPISPSPTLIYTSPPLFPPPTRKDGGPRGGGRGVGGYRSRVE
jgi:hypothetical protein